MSEPSARIVTCPTCRKRQQWSTSNPHRPFCSERCRLIDLGAWADADYRIGQDPGTSDVLSGDLEAGGEEDPSRR